MGRAGKSFRIYQSAAHGSRAVKIGFSWPACLLNLYWAVAKGLWWIALLILIAMFSLNIAASAVLRSYPLAAGIGANVIMVAGVVLLGIYGNNLVAARLERRGFVLGPTIKASGPQEALRLGRETDSAA